MKRAALLLLMVLTGAAQAQPAPTESVTVTGARSRQVLDRFVESFVAPTRLVGKIARWQDGVCPVTVGLKPVFTRFISARVKDVAAQVGAPVNAQSGCKPNIEIVFTTAPQKLLDTIRKENVAFLGYADNEAQRDALAKVSHPIQAWYLTATRDLAGKMDIDSGKTAGPGLEIWLPCSRTPGVCLMQMPNARAASVTGSRLGDGLRSTLYHVIVVVDPAKVAAHEIGALSDYISMLALSQLTALDTCQQLPSIVNLLAPGCGQKPDQMTENDRGYLRGLYKMGADRTLRSQQDEIAYQMERSLAGQ